MNQEVFYNISKIIERDSKTTTYKFALLRGTIDIIQNNSPFISFSEKEKSVVFPLGLLIEKWLLYYYPIFESKKEIPQINGDTKLAFSTELFELISYYDTKGGFSAFYNDLKNKGIPNDANDLFFKLIKKMRSTITKMPMKYIGRSISDDFYSIFHYENNILKIPEQIDIEWLINKSGTFSIPLDYYEAFKILGSFINGQESILFRWAEFSVNASRDNLSVNKVLNEILKHPITKREVKDVNKLYLSILAKKGGVHCVWTGKKIAKFDIDHVIPFSVWKNNDLWNLLPSDSKINNQKRDRIPSPNLIAKQKDLILYYWSLIYEHQKDRFKKEFQIALLGNKSFDLWRSEGIIQLEESCKFLIEKRGYEEWNI